MTPRWLLGLAFAWLGCPPTDPTTQPDDDDNTPVDDDDTTPDIPLPELGASMARAPVRILGVEGEPSMIGQAMVICDIDDDGLDDLLVGAPREAAERGIVAVFSGATAQNLAPDTGIQDCDFAFEGEIGDRLGYGVACGDIDGDGRTDLAVSGARYITPQVDHVFRLAVFHQPGDGWPPRTRPPDGGVLESDLGIVASPFPVQNWLELSAGDIDNDGAAEIILSDRVSGPQASPAGRVLVLPGGTCEGVGELDDAAAIELMPQSPESQQGGAILVADLDGAPGNELLIGEPFSGPPNNHFGKVSLLRAPLVSGAIADQAYAVIAESGEARAFGEAAAVGDVDGDGLTDLVVTGIEENIVGPEPRGSVWVYSDIASVDGDVAVNSGGGHVAGDPDGGYLGMQVSVGRDRDGDGASDVVVYQADLVDVPGSLWVLSGAEITGQVAPSDVSLARFSTERRGEQEDRFAVGDLDGDGIDDYAFGSSALEERMEMPFIDTGRAYVWLSSREARPEVKTTDWLALSLQISYLEDQGPVFTGTVTYQGQSTEWSQGGAVIEIDRREDLDLTLESPALVPHRIEGWAGDFDPFMMPSMVLGSTWNGLFISTGVVPDPALGHVMVYVLKRDGAGGAGVQVDIDAEHDGSFTLAQSDSFQAGDVVPMAPTDHSFVLFPNVPPGEVNVLLPSLEEGEVCWPGPGGVDGVAVEPVSVEAGTITSLFLRCKLSRL
jgi:hypothetical protein